MRRKNKTEGWEIYSMISALFTGLGLITIFISLILCLFSTEIMYFGFLFSYILMSLAVLFHVIAFKK